MTELRDAAGGPGRGLRPAIRGPGQDRHRPAAKSPGHGDRGRRPGPRSHPATGFSAWGRSPGPRGGSKRLGLAATTVLLDAGKKEHEHDRLRSLISSHVTEAADLGPADDSRTGLVGRGPAAAHPDRPHRLTVTVTGGDPSALGVAMVDPGGAGRAARVMLDACASGPPILKHGPPATFSWLVWPDTAEPLLVVAEPQPCPARCGVGSVKLARA